MRARWFIAAAGAVGAAHLLCRPRPNPGQLAALDNSGRLPDSQLPLIPPMHAVYTPASFPNLLALSGPELVADLEARIADTIRRGRLVEPAAIWNRICDEHGITDENAALRSALYWQEVMGIARAGQLDAEWADIYDIPTADPLEPT